MITLRKLLIVLKSWPLASRQPHEVDISLEAISDLSAGIDFSTIGIDNDFKHHFGMVASSPSAFIGPLKDLGSQRVDKLINNSNQMLLGDSLVQGRGEELDLMLRIVLKDDLSSFG